MLTAISVPAMLFTISHYNLEESFELLVLHLQEFNIVKESKLQLSLELLELILPTKLKV